MSDTITNKTNYVMITKSDDKEEKLMTDPSNHNNNQSRNKYYEHDTG